MRRRRGGFPPKFFSDYSLLSILEEIYASGIDVEVVRNTEQQELELKARFEKLLAAGDSKTLAHKKHRQQLRSW